MSKTRVSNLAGKAGHRHQGGACQAEDVGIRRQGRNLYCGRCPHVALLKDNVVLKYDVYSIAPYSEGHVELKIPYSRLNGILKPQWFPAQR